MDRLLTSKQSLSEALRINGVVPVLGPEAVLVEIGEGGDRVTVPFYQLVTDELLRTYGTTLPPEPALSGHNSWLLHRAVSQVLADCDDVSAERLRRSVTSIMKTISGRVTSSLLARLAALRAFDLFICLTPDDCLVQALQQQLGPDNVEVTAYAPNADSSRPVDVAPARTGVARVFYPLGRSVTGRGSPSTRKMRSNTCINFRRRASAVRRICSRTFAAGTCCCSDAICRIGWDAVFCAWQMSRVFRRKIRRWSSSPPMRGIRR
jgi:hypothetical protein